MKSNFPQVYLVRHGETGWLFPTGDEAALADLLRDEVSRDAATAMDTVTAHDGGVDEWADYAAALIETTVAQL